MKRYRKCVIYIQWNIVSVCMHAQLFSLVQLFATVWKGTKLDLSRFLCPWYFPGKNTGKGCYFLFQEIFLTQGSNPCFWYVHGLFTAEPLGKPTVEYYSALTKVFFRMWEHVWIWRTLYWNKTAKKNPNILWPQLYAIAKFVKHI